MLKTQAFNIFSRYIVYFNIYNLFLDSITIRYQAKSASTSAAVYYTIPLVLLALSKSASQYSTTLPSLCLATVNSYLNPFVAVIVWGAEPMNVIPCLI